MDRNPKLELQIAINAAVNTAAARCKALVFNRRRTPSFGTRFQAAGLFKANMHTTAACNKMNGRTRIRLRGDPHSTTLVGRQDPVVCGVPLGCVDPTSEGNMG